MDDELPRLQVDGGAWYDAVPPPAVPVPVGNMPPDLHGARAVLARPGHGLLYDLRVLGNTGAHLTVCHELDYWRTRFTPSVQVTPQSVAAEQLWIEHRLDYEPPAGPEPKPRPAVGDPATLLRRLAPGPEQPGARTPVPARTVGNLHGRRIVQVTPLGFAWDLRAVSEPYQSAEGDILLNLASANDYYRWILTGEPPEPTPVGLYLCWTE